MKLKHLFFASVALISFAACGDDSDCPPQNEEIVNTYMTLQLTGTPLTSVRTLSNGGAADGGVAQGTEVEKKISNLMVLLYDESGVLKKTYLTDDVRNTVDGAQTAIFPISTGKYQVYVIANYGEKEAGWGSMPGVDVKNLTLDEVNEVMMRNYYAKDNHFIMFNQCNGSDKQAGVPIEISPVNTYKNPATCTVRMDRLAVKVQSGLGTLDITGMEADLASTEFKNLGVKLLGYKLLNGSTKAYLQQRWTNAETAVYPFNNSLITPWLTGDAEPVTFDFYNRLSDFRTVTYNAEEEYVTVRDNYAQLGFYNGVAGPIYCMENNSTWNGTSVVDAMKGNTTGLVYQFLMNFDGSDKKAGEYSFYAYGGKFFPSLKSLQAVYPHALDKADVSSDRAVDLAAAEAELRAAYDSANPSDAISDFRAKYRIKVYMDGLMYYIYYIKDRNYAEGGNAYYALMRNTIYDLTVQKLLRIGDDIPGGWNPDTKPVDPVDPTNTYMNVTVSVNPWVMNKEEIDLK